MKFLKSKFAVIATLFVILGIGLVKQVSASSDNYNFSTCYQYYMLDNRRDSTKLQAGNQKIANIAPLGSGGISGTFSYNDIVNSAPNDKSESTATKFVSMMATYSTFKYFSNKVQGFESWGGYIGRFLLMILLLPLSVMMDFVTMLVPAMIKAFATFNIIPFLGAMLTNFTFKSGMIDALGLSKAQVTAFFNAFLSFAIAAIVISLVMALRRGSQNIDKRHLRKFETRILTLMVLPLVIGAMATLLQSVGDIVGKVPALDATFSRYLIDDRSWAYNYNFAPIGNSNKKSDIKGNSGSFVDLSFDPYDPNGRDRIAQINQNSSLAGKGSIFPNSALLLAYGMSQSFSATDYINFEGSEQSTHLLGQAPDTRSTFGSYYLDALSFSNKQLLDTKHAYLPSSHQQTNKKDQEGSYTAAIDDYDAGHNQLNTSNVNTWRDRFIYGVKNSGNLDKYYGETPSQEMVKNQVGGTSAATVPSDQSMFLILSTIFEENGGRYYINAPARGIKQVQGQFDSNRSEYYVVSMIGNPFFSIIGMLTQPLLTLIVLFALILAIMSVGILDMNIKPLAAVFKAEIAGDIEYLEAFVFYSLGIAGTTVMFVIMPSILIMLMTGISRFVVQAIPRAANMVPSSAQQSLAFNGVPLIIQGIVSILFGFFWFKSSKFRDRLNELFCMPWNWAQAASRRVENQVSVDSTGTKYFARKANTRAERPFAAAQKLNERLKNLALSALSATPYAPVAEAAKGLDNLRKSKNVVESNNLPNPDPLQDSPVSPDDSDDSDDPTTPDNGAIKTQNNSREPQTPDEIKRKGQFDRIGNDLTDIQNDPNTSRPTVDRILETQKLIGEFKVKPNQQNYDAVNDRLNELQHHLWNNGVSKPQLVAANKAAKEFSNVGEEYHLDTNKLNKPVVSQNSELTDNDDAKFEGRSDRQADTNVIKPKPEKPVNSEHQAKDVSVPRTETKPTVLKDSTNNRPNTTVIKPKSEKPVASSHNNHVAERPITTQQKIVNDPYANKATVSNNAGTTVVKPKSEKTVLTKHDKVMTAHHTKVLNNRSSRITSYREPAGSKTNGVNKSVQNFNKVRNIVSKKENSGNTRSVNNNTVQRMIKNSNHMNRTMNRSHITQIPKKQIQSKLTKQHEIRVERTNNTQSIIKHHSKILSRATSNTSKHVVEKSIVEPTAHNFVTDNQLKGVVSALGDAMKNKRVKVSLHNLSQSKNISEVKHNIRGLQKVVRALDPKTKNQINKGHLVDNLFDLQNSNKFGGKE